MYLAKPVIVILAKRVVGYLAIPVVYLAICCVLHFFRLFKIVVVYLAIFFVYLAKP